LARERATAVRATMTKLGPGLIAPRVSAPAMAKSGKKPAIGARVDVIDTTGFLDYVVPMYQNT